MPDAGIEKISRDIEVLGKDFTRPKDLPDMYPGMLLPEGTLITAADPDGEGAKNRARRMAAEYSERIALAATNAAGRAGSAVAAIPGNAVSGAKTTTTKVIIPGLERMWEREKTGVTFVSAAIILSILDFLTRWFGGLDITEMLKNYSVVSNILRVNALNAVVLIVVFSYFFIKGIRNVSKEEMVSFFLFVEVTYFCLTLGGLSAGVLVHVGFAIATWFMLRGDKNMGPYEANTVVAFLLFLDFFGIGFTGWLGARNGIAEFSILGNRLASPVWFLFSLIYTSRYEKKPVWLKFVVGLVVVLYIFAFVGESFTYAAFAQRLSQKEIREGKTIIQKSLSNAAKYGGEIVASMSSGTGGWWEKWILTATGGYYYGNAEDTKPVGIFLAIDEPEGDVPAKTSFSADVSANTLGTQESVSVTAKCWWGEDYEEENEGVITPSEQDISDGESGTVRCKFENLDEEADQISFEAGASGLEATGELPVFFIDSEQRSKLKKAGEDLFFGAYEGKTAKPEITYTNGPLAIETTALNQPIGIGEEDVELAFGIRLRNAWDNGEIGKVKTLKVTTPKGVELSDCDYEFVLQRTEAQNIYSFETSEFVPLEDIDEKAVFLCDMTVKVNEKSNLIIGPMQVHPRFFYITVIYDFKIKDSISVSVIGSVKEKEYANGGISGGASGSSSGGSNPPGSASPLPPTATTPEYETTTSEEENMRNKIINEAEKQGVDWKYALGIAYLEHNGKLAHEGIESQDQWHSVGLFQITPGFHAVAGGTCEDMTSNDLTDLDNNIECGVRIIKKYYTSGCQLFNPDGNCRNIEYCGWDRAARSYVGWLCRKYKYGSCGEMCDLKYDYYVEMVRCYIEQFDNPSTISTCEINLNKEIYYTTKDGEKHYTFGE